MSTHMLSWRNKKKHFWIEKCILSRALVFIVCTCQKVRFLAFWLGSFWQTFSGLFIWKSKGLSETLRDILISTDQISVQLILAYSWARPAILVTVEEGCFCFFTFISDPPSLSLLSPILSLLYFSHSQGNNTEWSTRVDVSLNPYTINQD